MELMRRRRIRPPRSDQQRRADAAATTRSAAAAAQSTDEQPHDRELSTRCHRFHSSESRQGRWLASKDDCMLRAAELSHAHATAEASSRRHSAAPLSASRQREWTQPSNSSISHCDSCRPMPTAHCCCHARAALRLCADCLPSCRLPFLLSRAAASIRSQPISTPHSSPFRLTFDPSATATPLR